MVRDMSRRCREEQPRSYARLTRASAAAVVLVLLISVAGELYATGDGAETYQVAVGALKDRLWQTAADQFRALLRNRPHSEYAPSATYYLGFCCFQLHDFNGAKRYLKSYLSGWPRGEFATPCRYYLGRSLLESGQPREARPLLHQVASGKGGLVIAAKFWLGRVFSQMAQWSEAAKLYTEVVESGDTRYAESAAYELGRALASGEEYARSLKAIRPLLRQTKNEDLRLKAWLLLADDLFGLEKYRETINETRKIIGVAPASSSIRSKALALQAKSLRLLGDLKAAVDVFRAYLKASPDSQHTAWAVQNIIECLVSLHNCQEASQALLLWANALPQEVLGDLGVEISGCYSGLGQEAAAIKTLKFTLNRLRSGRLKLPVAVKLADSYFRSGKFSQVVLLLSPMLGRGILSQDKEVAAAALLLVGASHEKLRSFDEAGSDYRLLLSLNPSRELRWVARIRLSNLLIESGNLEDAKTMLWRMGSESRLDEGLADVVAKLVEALRDRGDSRDALLVARDAIDRLWSPGPEGQSPNEGVGNAFLTALSGRHLCDIILKIAKASPGDSDAALRARLLLDAGECCFTSGEDASASTIYMRFVREFPQSPELYVVLSRLGTIAFRAGDFAEAAKLFKSAARKAPPGKGCELVYMACESLFRLGRLDEALLGFKRVIASSDCRGRVVQSSYLKCGLVWEEFGDFKRARSAYLTCASMGFDETATAVARARLARLGD